MAPSRKRPLSPPALVPNPFIKKRNLAWSLESPSSYPDPHSATSSTPAAATTATAFTSAPPADNTAAISTDISTSTAISPPAAPRPTAGTTAEIESGAVQISDHLAQFTSLLSSHQRPTSALVPRLSISGYSSLYQRCAGSPSGAHFVIHQHDHPVAGTHYDLRLQINETSSVSWAIMYGLPGDANSSRLNRNATETRIHSLWASFSLSTYCLIPSTDTIHIYSMYRIILSRQLLQKQDLSLYGTQAHIPSSHAAANTPLQKTPLHRQALPTHHHRLQTTSSTLQQRSLSSTRRFKTARSGCVSTGRSCPIHTSSTSA